jgi:rhodanese-related sulfurtransferase
MILLSVLALIFLLLFSGCQEYAAKFIGVRSIDARDLIKIIESKVPPLVLDVRKIQNYRTGHIAGAIPLDMRDIADYLDTTDLPHRQTIVTVCSSGWESQIAAAGIMARGYRNVYNLTGGINRWKQLGYPVHPASDKAVADKTLKPPIIKISLLSQVAMTVAAFVVKPAYIVMAFLVIWMLRHKKSRDLVLLRYAMVVFFIGENACTLNYLAASNASVWLEFLHGLGMVGMFFFLFWGLILFFDQRVIHYLDPERPCAFKRHCGHCWKKEDVSCGLHRLANYLLPALAFVALIPVTMPLRPFRIIMPVFSSDVLWLKDFWNLLVEFRIYPMLGALGFITTLYWTHKGRDHLPKAQLPFCLALGFTSYSLFRFGLLLTFSENQAWADWWEESTEFIMVFMLLLFLVVFKNQLELDTPWPLNKFKRIKPSSVPQAEANGIEPRGS